MEIVYFFGQVSLKKEVERMREEHDDLVVLEEGHSLEAVQTCCTANAAKI